MNLIQLLIDILIFCVIGGIVYWIITLLPLPQPFKQIAVVVVLLILLLVALNWLLPLGGFGRSFLR
jgi:hypothetical protein